MSGDSFVYNSNQSKPPDGHSLREKEREVPDLVGKLVTENCHRGGETGCQAEDDQIQ